MAERVRFHLDEHIDPDIARALRRHGVDVTTTVEAHLISRSDQDQLEYARRSSRVLVSHDTDFLRMSSRDSDHPGIVYSHRTALSVGEMIRRLILAFEVLTADEIRGRVEFL